MINSRIAVCALSAIDIYSREKLISRFSAFGEVFLLCPETIEEGRFPANVHYERIIVSRTGTNPFADLNTISGIQAVLGKVKADTLFAYSGAKAVIYSLIAAKRLHIRDAYCVINGLGSIFRVDSLKNKALRVLMTGMYRYSLRGAKGVFFQNSDDMSYFADRKIARGSCSVIPGTGVDTSKYPYSEKVPGMTCLFVGRLLRDKGIYEYVAAAEAVKRTIPESRFIVVGDFDTNPMAISHEEMTAWERKGTVEYWGHRDDMFNVYNSCDLFVLPSYHEGLPRTSMEAMSVGRAIVTTDAPGCRDTVYAGRNGILVPVRDNEKLTEAIKELLLSPERLQSMGMESRRIAEEVFNADQINNSFVQKMMED